MSHGVADAFHKGVESADNTTMMSGPWVLNVLAASLCARYRVLPRDGSVRTTKL